MCNWLFYCLKGDYTEIETELPPERTSTALLLSIGYNGLLYLQTGHYIYQTVRLFDYNINALYPHQIDGLNKIYSGKHIHIKWMDIVACVTHNESGVRVCQIWINGEDFSGCISRYINL